MSEGNTLYLVCWPCHEAEEADFGVKLASRDRIGFYTHDAPSKTLDAWMSLHRKCGGRNHPDHFRIAHLHNPDHDQPPDVSPIVEAMRVNGSN